MANLILLGPDDIGLKAISYMPELLRRAPETRFDCGSHTKRFDQHGVDETAPSRGREPGDPSSRADRENGGRYGRGETPC
jgi:hypothetical protein